MIATGVLDYSLVPETLDDDVLQPAKVPKARTS
jgi:hypothetical protein